MKTIFMCVFLFLLVPCAAAQNERDRHAAAGSPADECSGVMPLNEAAVRKVIYESKKYWDAVSSYVESLKKTGKPAETTEHFFPVHNREFEKFYGNAVLLYLRGDVSCDFLKYLITIKQLLSIARNCYPVEGADIPHVMALKEVCISVESLEPDPKRFMLYKLRTSWDELCTHMLGRRFEGGKPFEQLNREFAKHYDAALSLYLQGNSSSEEFDRHIDTLKGLLAEAYDRRRDSGKSGE